MRILGIGVIIGALLLASAAEADKDWYVLSLGECRISSDLKNPAAFIIDLKAIGRQYHVEDRRDATGRIVASFVTDETIGAQIAFFRTIDLCLEERENIRSQQQQENSDLKNKYR